MNNTNQLGQPDYIPMQQYAYIPENNASQYEQPTFKQNYLNSAELPRLGALNKLYAELKNVLLDKRVGLEPLQVNDLLFNQKTFNDKDLNRFYRHLLNYTYASTALEVKNHEEVNAHLKEIHRLLKTLVKEEPKAPTQALPPAT
jgi:hypothetical protein